MNREAGKWLVVALAVLGLLAISSGVRAEEPKKNGSPHGGETGPTPAVLTSPNIKLEVHSSIQLDFVGFSDKEDSIPKVAGSQENNIFAKRIRLTFKGKLFNNVGFYLTAAYDQSPSTNVAAPYVIDAQINLPAAPWLDFTFGLMKEPFSEERIKSFATHMPFMERSLASNLENKRSTGTMLRLHTPDKDALALYLGCFTGEPLGTPNTDDFFEYVGRGVVRFDQLFDGFPGVANIGGSYAYGRRQPVRDVTNSYSGKTVNELTFFSAVPVNGMRTRWEADAEWRYQMIWIGGEFIHSMEERNKVMINVKTPTSPTSKDTVKRTLDPLEEEGYMAFIVIVLTGEEAKPIIEPKNEFGAVSLAIRYSMVSYDNGSNHIRAKAAGVYGPEINDTSMALGRKSIDEAVRDLSVGLNWDLKPGVFIQFAVIYQWFDASNPYNNSRAPGHYDVNYRGRVGVTF